MTLISIGAFERAMTDVPGGRVGELIARTHQLIQVTLNQHYPGDDLGDGLELAACYFVPDEDQMTFVGARSELFIVDGDEIHTIKGTKKGLAYRGIPYGQEFEETAVPVKPGKRFYMSTDGLTDQVGGRRRLMFGKKRFLERLMSLKDVPMGEQMTLLKESLVAYQGDEPRRDDVSVIGFTLT